MPFAFAWKRSAIREKKGIEGTGTNIRIEVVPFAAIKQKGTEQKYSAVSTFLRLTGLAGVADGQFS